MALAVPVAVMLPAGRRTDFGGLTSDAILHAIPAQAGHHHCIAD